MSTTLSNGFVLPSTGDKGDPVFTAMEGNIQQVNDHTHDGADSEQLTSNIIKRTTVNVDATGWSLAGDGTSLYLKPLNLPSGFDWSDDDFQPSIKFYFDEASPTDEHEVFIKWEKNGATGMVLYSVTNSQAYKVVFL